MCSASRSVPIASAPSMCITAAMAPRIMQARIVATSVQISNAPSETRSIQRRCPAMASATGCAVASGIGSGRGNR